MRIARLHGPRDLRVEEGPEPDITDDQVLVRVKAAGVCGSDVHYYRDGRIGDLRVAAPLVLGHEISGEVARVGARVRGFEAGMPVAVEPGVACLQCEQCLEGHYNLCRAKTYCGTPPTDGGFREFLPWWPRGLHPLPEGLTHGEGVLIETLAVSLHAVDLGHLKVGCSAAIFGLGPIGQTVLQAARLGGAVDVYCVDLLPERVRRAEAAGGIGIDASRVDPVATIGRLTGGRGVDAAFEAAGALETPAQCVAVTRPGGRVVLIGICEADQTPLQSGPARRKGLSLMFVRQMRHTYPRCIALTARGLVDLRSLVTHTVPLERITEAFHMVESYRDQAMKVLIAPGSPD